MAQGTERMGDRVVTALVAGYLTVSRVLPLPLVRAVTLGLGRLALRVYPRLWRVGMQNLDLAYGESIPLARKRAILRGAMDNMALVAAEFSRLPTMLGKGSHATVSIEGGEHIDLSRPGLFFSAHISNWELMAACTRRFGVEMAIVVRPLRQAGLNALVDATRRAAGSETIGKDDASTEIFARLKAGKHVGLLIDQAPRDNAVPVKFFGQPCWATIAPVMIAVRAKVPVYPVSMYRKANGHYVLRAHPPMTLARSGDLRRDIEVNTQRFQDELEAMIRENPDEWLWFHRRWKARPRLAEEWAARKQRDR